MLTRFVLVSLFQQHSPLAQEATEPIFWNTEQMMAQHGQNGMFTFRELP